MLTKSQINRAGKVLRTYILSPDDSEIGDDEMAALDVLHQFRAEHAKPLVKANNGLRSMVKSEGYDADVSQRLKRFSTILSKIRREPTMALSRMQDIGGCRAILPSIPAIRQVERRITRTRPVVGYSDYISTPRASGYRGVHLVVSYDDRSIEIQLRTPVMHEWAVMVERLGGRLDEDLKSGYGPGEVLAWLEMISQALAIEEAGNIVDSEMVDRITALRGEAIPIIERGKA